MYDGLTTRYRFACPLRGEARVLLSAFRRLEPLPGTAHPAVFQVRFACSCGAEHPGLVTQEELDWAPIGLEAGRFLNLMTARFDEVSAELGDLAARRIEAGEWPWSFFCFHEERPRPVSPSSFWLLTPDVATGWVGLAVHCSACAEISVNVVSCHHVDLPFYNDREVGVVEQRFGPEVLRSSEAFLAELAGAPIEPRRLAAA